MTAGYWEALGVVALINALYIGFATLRSRQRLRHSVFDNLDSAYENGYFDAGEQLFGATAAEIAQDMALYAVDFEGLYYVDDITPHVRAWLYRKGWHSR